MSTKTVILQIFSKPQVFFRATHQKDINVAKSGSGMSFNTLFEDVLFSELPVYVHIVIASTYISVIRPNIYVFFFKQMHFKNIKISKSTVVLT